MTSLVWFRGEELRFADHVPLRDAAQSGEVIPLLVLGSYFFEPSRAVELPYRMQFLLVPSLQQNPTARGTRLIFVRGKSVDVALRLAVAWKVDRVLSQRWVEPFAQQRDERIRQKLTSDFKLYEGETLLPPGALRTVSGKPYSTFSQATAQIQLPALAPRFLPSVPGDVSAEEVTIPSCSELGTRESPALQRRRRACPARAGFAGFRRRGTWPARARPAPVNPSP